MNKLLILLVLFAVNSYSNLGSNVMLGLGEAPQMELRDVGGSAAYPQVGFSLEYRTKYITPFNEVLIGKFNSGFTYENYFGIQVGKKISFIKPSLTFGAGI
ncbi:MAG: hypothetical protein HRT71_15335 [Flavobacteriales bacterium]|nr:hypothetical protein [Flavobacteriales bacterium]